MTNAVQRNEHEKLYLELFCKNCWTNERADLKSERRPMHLTKAKSLKQGNATDTVSGWDTTVLLRGSRTEFICTNSMGPILPLQPNSRPASKENYHILRIPKDNLIAWLKGVRHFSLIMIQLFSVNSRYLSYRPWQRIPNKPKDIIRIHYGRALCSPMAREWINEFTWNILRSSQLGGKSLYNLL